MIEDDGGFMRRETAREVVGPDEDLVAEDEDVDFGDREDNYWYGRE